METGHPLTRAVNSGSGNRALGSADIATCVADGRSRTVYRSLTRKYTPTHNGLQRHVFVSVV